MTGRLTWDITAKDVCDFPQLSTLIDEHGVEPEVVKYLVFRFDPGSTDVRSSPTPEDKVRVASKMAGWSPPAPGHGEDGVPSAEFQQYMALETDFLRLYDPMWTMLESMLESMYSNMQIMRMPIDMSLDPETLGKIQTNNSKAVEAVDKCMAVYTRRLAEFVDADAAAAARVSGAMRSGGRQYRDLTGRKNGA